MAHTPKSNPAEIDNRVKQCIIWTREGKTRSVIVRDGSQQWGVSTRQVDDYFSEALRRIKESFDKEQATLIAQIADKLDYIYEKGINGVSRGVNKDSDEIIVEDLTNARQALMDKAKLAGLLKDKIEIDDIKAPDLSNADPKKIREKLRKS